LATGTAAEFCHLGLVAVYITPSFCPMTLHISSQMLQFSVIYPIIFPQHLMDQGKKFTLMMRLLKCLSPLLAVMHRALYRNRTFSSSRH
jgi:hypothetical protein